MPQCGARRRTLLACFASRASRFGFLVSGVGRHTAPGYRVPSYTGCGIRATGFSGAGEEPGRNASPLMDISF
ncbi:hypothetical protein T484DRAFT_1977680 [Baffinella frigidus]|nr:hypothetical protein T484DRAFT_1977680 [Cryptophyta sp. CCMP2293]